MRKRWRTVVVEVLRDLWLFGGIGSIVYGVWLAWPPGAYMVGGAAAVLLARGLMPGASAHAG